MWYDIKRIKYIRVGFENFWHWRVDSIDKVFSRRNPIHLSRFQAGLQLDCRSFSKSLFIKIRLKKCPNGVLTEKNLIHIYSHYFLCGDCTMFAKHLFSALVQHIAMSNMSHESFKIKEINFKQFVQILSSVMRGSLDEKIRWMFYFYDMNKDGIITHDVRGSFFSMHWLIKFLFGKDFFEFFFLIYIKVNFPLGFHNN